MEIQNPLIPIRTMNEVLRTGNFPAISVGQASYQLPEGQVSSKARMGELLIRPRLIGPTIEGGSFRSNQSGARIEIFPEFDPTIGILAYDDSGNEVFKVMLGGTDVGDVIMGDYAGEQGAKWDKSLDTFSIKGTLVATKTFQLAMFTQEVDTTDSIQTAIDAVYAAGGGEVILKNGTHTPSSDITLYSGVYLRGQTAQSTIIDFNSQTYGIIAAGSNAYSTGTVAVNNGSATVTGTTTVWTTAMIGRSILLSGIWYTISDVNEGTQVITIASNYIDANLSGASYVIATTINDIKLSDFTVKNSTVSAIKVQYGNFGNIDGIIAITSLVGIEFRDSSTYTFGISSIDGFYNYTNFIWNNVHYVTTTGAGSIVTLSGNGWEISNCTNCGINDSFIIGSVGDGIQFTGCSSMILKGVTCKGNGGQGIDLVSGNSKIIFNGVGLESNVSDGIKLTATSDNCMIVNCLIFDNGGYGINIAAATCDNNFIGQNQYSGNSSGNLSDSGTSTTIINTNQIVLDTSGYIRGGQTDYDTGTGFFLGYSGAAYKFSLGSSTGNRLTWDGSVLTLIGKTNYSAGNYLIQSADTERTSSVTSYTLKKEISVGRAGTYRVKFDMHSSTTETEYAKVYKNGVAFGTEQTVNQADYVTKSEDLVFDTGDLIQLYVKAGTGTVSIRNFRLYIDQFDITTVNTD